MRLRDEAGTAVVELTWLTLLLLVPLVYLLLAVFDVQRASYGLSAAAQAAARAYTLAPDEASAPARARAAAAVALRDQGVEVEAVDLDVRCRPAPGNCLAPGSLITVALRHQVVLPLIPDALAGGSGSGSGGVPTFRVEASHTIAYGTYREDR